MSETEKHIKKAQGLVRDYFLEPGEESYDVDDVIKELDAALDSLNQARADDNGMALDPGMGYA
jgi:hypothetical protein